MVSAEQSKANVRSAARILAAQLGIYQNDGSGFNYSNLGAADQIRLTNALADYIEANPTLFDAATIANARQSHNQQIAAPGGSLDVFVDSFLSNARAINPLDAQNIGTVGTYLLVAAVVLGVAYIVVNRKGQQSAA